MGNLFIPIPFLSKAKKRKAWALNMKERGVQKLCEKCQWDCKVLGAIKGSETRSKFVCFLFKARRSDK